MTSTIRAASPAIVLLGVSLAGAEPLAAQGASAGARRSAAPPMAGGWRITSGRRAPWEIPSPPDTIAWLGTRVRFATNRVEGPAPLRCNGAGYRQREVSADALFQGNLPDPKEGVARTLGVGRFPVTSVEVTCATGSFDFHRIGRDTLLIAVDNVVWTLVRERPGRR